MTRQIFPHTTSRRIVLRPASSPDHPSFLQALLRTGLESFRPTSIPSAEVSTLYNAAFLVARRIDNQVLGFSTLHWLDPAGHIRCGIYLDTQRARLGIGSEAVHLSINYAFAMFNVDKVIAQTTEASFGAFGLTPNDSHQERVLPEDVYFRGKLWSLHHFELERRTWDEYIDQNVDGVLTPPLAWRTAPPPVAGGS